MDGSSVVGLRLDGERSVEQLQALFHTDESQAAVLSGCFAVKSCAGIAHGEVDLVRRDPQTHLEASCAAVLQGIVQGFLKYSKQAQRNGRGERAGQIAGLAVNFYSVLHRELTA